MVRCYHALASDIFNDLTGALQWLKFTDWFPDSVSAWPTENGSLTKETIGYVMSHINFHAKRKPKSNHKILLLLDGNNSRNGVVWLEKAKLYEIEVIQNPANTSHFLQACDNPINHIFQTTIRRTQDYLNTFSFFATLLT